MEVLHALVDRGNTVLVIEHNIDVIRTADYVIDIGPEGGSGGGNCLYQGERGGLKEVKGSQTALFL
jgi:excinuclease ABC subunit A